MAIFTRPKNAEGKDETFKKEIHTKLSSCVSYTSTIIYDMLTREQLPPFHRTICVLTDDSSFHCGEKSPCFRHKEDGPPTERDEPFLYYLLLTVYRVIPKINFQFACQISIDFHFSCGLFLSLRSLIMQNQ